MLNILMKKKVIKVYTVWFHIYKYIWIHSANKYWAPTMHTPGIVDIDICVCVCVMADFNFLILFFQFIYNEYLSIF